MKKLIVFDLDGTLALSMSAIDEGMARLLDQLLKVVKVSGHAGWCLCYSRQWTGRGEEGD